MLALAVAAAWAAIGALAVLVVLAAGAITRRRISLDEHFDQAAGIIREDAGPESADWDIRELSP